MAKVVKDKKGNNTQWRAKLVKALNSLLTDEQTALEAIENLQKWGFTPALAITSDFIETYKTALEMQAVDKDLSAAEITRLKNDLGLSTKISNSVDAQKQAERAELTKLEADIKALEKEKARAARVQRGIVRGLAAQEKMMVAEPVKAPVVSLDDMKLALMERFMGSGQANFLTPEIVADKPEVEEKAPVVDLLAQEKSLLNLSGDIVQDFETAKTAFEFAQNNEEFVAAAKILKDLAVTKKYRSAQDYFKANRDDINDAVNSRVITQIAAADKVDPNMGQVITLVPKKGNPPTADDVTAYAIAAAESIEGKPDLTNKNLSEMLEIAREAGERDDHRTAFEILRVIANGHPMSQHVSAIIEAKLAIGMIYADEKLAAEAGVTVDLDKAISNFSDVLSNTFVGAIPSEEAYNNISAQYNKLWEKKEAAEAESISDDVNDELLLTDRVDVKSSVSIADRAKNVGKNLAHIAKEFAMGGADHYGDFFKGVGNLFKATAKVGVSLRDASKNFAVSLFNKDTSGTIEKPKVSLVDRARAVGYALANMPVSLMNEAKSAAIKLYQEKDNLLPATIVGATAITSKLLMGASAMAIAPAMGVAVAVGAPAAILLNIRKEWRESVIEKNKLDLAERLIAEKGLKISEFLDDGVTAPDDLRMLEDEHRKALVEKVLQGVSRGSYDDRASYNFRQSLGASLHDLVRREAWAHMIDNKKIARTLGRGILGAGSQAGIFVGLTHAVQNGAEILNKFSETLDNGTKAALPKAPATVLEPKPPAGAGSSAVVPSQAGGASVAPVESPQAPQTTGKPDWDLSQQEVRGSLRPTGASMADFADMTEAKKLEDVRSMLREAGIDPTEAGRIVDSRVALNALSPQDVKDAARAMLAIDREKALELYRRAAGDGNRQAIRDLAGLGHPFKPDVVAAASPSVAEAAPPRPSTPVVDRPVVTAETPVQMYNTREQVAAASERMHQERIAAAAAAAERADQYQFPRETNRVADFGDVTNGFADAARVNRFLDPSILDRGAVATAQMRDVVGLTYNGYRLDVPMCEGESVEGIMHALFVPENGKMVLHPSIRAVAQNLGDFHAGRAGFDTNAFPRNLTYTFGGQTIVGQGNIVSFLTPRISDCMARIRGYADFVRTAMGSAAPSPVLASATPN